MPRELQQNNPRLQGLREALTDQDSYVTTLIIVVIDLFGSEVFEWTPETIRLEVWDDLQAELPQKNLDKIMAGIAVITTDDFYQNLPRFISLCNIIADDEFDPTIFEPADSSEMAWAITEMLLLDPPEDPENAFSDDIRYYIGEVLSEEGIVNPPDVLAVAKLDGHNPDPMANMSDDPVMYNAFWDSQSAKGNDITQMLRLQLMELMQQVTGLPLSEDANTADLTKRMRRELLNGEEE